MRRVPTYVSLVLAAVLGCGDGTAPAPSTPQWVKLTGNPVLTHGDAASWDGFEVARPCVVARGGSYAMWYTGRDGTTSRIGLATSADGITWTKDANNPVFGPGAPGAWDALGVQDPCVIFDGATYRLYYTGAGASGRQIGLATSADGVHWTRSGADPVLSPASTPTAWDASEVFTPWALRDGGTFRLWFAGTGPSSLSIGYATSADGVLWTKLLAPVLDGMVLEAPDYAPCVVGGGNAFQIWYVARHEFTGGFLPGAIDYAQSHDGIEWTVFRTVLSPGPAGAWDDRALNAACVVANGGRLRMWYEGRGAHAAGDSTLEWSAIGLATYP